MILRTGATTCTRSFWRSRIDRMFFPLKPRFARNIITRLCRTKTMRED